MTQPPLKPNRDWEPWERVARELGDFDIEDTGAAFMSYRELVRVDDADYLGDWIEAEPACKRIVAAEEALAEANDRIHVLERLLSEVDPDGYREIRR